MDKSAVVNKTDLSKPFLYQTNGSVGGVLCTQNTKTPEQEWLPKQNISLKCSSKLQSNDTTVTASTTNNDDKISIATNSNCSSKTVHPVNNAFENFILPRHMRNLSKTQSLDIIDDDDSSEDRIRENDLTCSSQQESPNTFNTDCQATFNESATCLLIPTTTNTLASTTNSGTNSIIFNSTFNKFNEQMRPIYPNVPYSPYASPYGSPRSGRRRAPLRESRRVSIEQAGSFLQLNQYKLMDQIGQGSYGLVKLAYSEEDSTHYAMKILSKRRLLRKVGLLGRGPKQINKQRTSSPLDRVYREIAVLKKLDHPNIVKLVEVLDDPLEDSLYLVFELVQLGEVLSIPTDKPLTEERAWGVFRDVLLGLEYLHYQKICHGDIKPGNLLLGECGRVKIADLGVCNEFIGDDSFVNTTSGTPATPAFRAPETLFIGEHTYSGKGTDIWALGATLYSFVYGNVPYLAQSVPAVYEKIKNDDVEYPGKTISADLKDLLAKMLNKNSAERITLPKIKEHKWVTKDSAFPLPTEEENCILVQITESDINSVVKSIPKLDTLILIKTMLKKHSFQNPFTKNLQKKKLERFSRAGRSNSAPEYPIPERQMSSDNLLPSLAEGVLSNEFSSKLNIRDDNNKLT